MIIRRASVLGMCMGVRRAETLARQAAEFGKVRGKRVFTYGPLIHNPQAVEGLQAVGAKALDVEAFEEGRLDDIAADSIVVIRAHGAPPKTFEHLASLGAEIVDATCPRVLQSQEKARKLSDEGYSVVIAGDRAHAEVAGLLGQAPDALVVEDVLEAEQVAKKLASQKVALIAQTTIKKSEYEAIAEKFSLHCRQLLAVESICPATVDRQTALAALARQVDALVIVGGKGSANTQRLFLAARESGKPSWHIETATELPDVIFSYERIGLTAGASTPDFMVDEVERFLMNGAG